MKTSGRIGMFALLAGTALAAVPALADDYKIGVSNTVQGNGWREEMICAIKAQALASGKVASLNIAHRNTDAAGQLEDIRPASTPSSSTRPTRPASTRRSRKRPTPASLSWSSTRR